MRMTKTLAEMKAMLTPAQRKAVDKRVLELAAEEMSLLELRKAQAVTQTVLAKKLGKTQVAVSRTENSADLYLSTLREHVEALGGKLDLRAEFPNRPPVSIVGRLASPPLPAKVKNAAPHSKAHPSKTKATMRPSPIGRHRQRAAVAAKTR